MFIRNMWYTPQDIIALKNTDDVIFIDGLSFTDSELLEDFTNIRLRFYRYDIELGHQMFTMLKGGE
jgi:hypothetical protein